MLLLGVEKTIADLGMSQDFENYEVGRLGLMVYERLEQGMSKEEIVEFLVHRVGFERAAAQEVVDVVSAEQSKAEGEE